MNLFWVAVVLKPTVRAAEEGETAKIIVQPQCVVAKDKDGATVKAGKLIPTEHEDKDDRLEVAVSPF